MPTIGRGCDHQSPPMFLCQPLKPKRVIEPFGSLVHVPGTVILHPFRKQKVYRFSKTSLKCTYYDVVTMSINICADSIAQCCPTRGPRAACGPRTDCKWPAPAH